MTQAAQLAQYGSNNVGLSFKNRILNGDFGIDQRNAGASVTPTDGAYTLDRWKMLMYNSASKYTVQQNAGSVTPPAGFSNYMGITSSSAYSVASTDLYGIQQRIEGFNTADFNWGTANAATVTLSFWVRSSLTGTFGGAIQNSGGNRSYPFSYTISAANTWEQKSITIAGDTSGTWVGSTNGIGMVVYLMIGTGSTFSGTAGAWAAGEFYSATGAVSVVGTSGATFYITGVQLEVGSVATSFDYLPYTTELQLCQRYYWRTIGSGSTYPAVGAGGYISTTNFSAFIPYPVQMRATPTFSISSDLYIPIVGFPSVTAISANYANQYSARLEFTTSTSVAGYGGSVALNNSTASFIAASAEL